MMTPGGSRLDCEIANVLSIERKVHRSRSSSCRSLSKWARCGPRRGAADAGGRAWAEQDGEVLRHAAGGPSASTVAPARIAGLTTPVAYSTALAIAMAACARTRAKSERTFVNRFEGPNPFPVATATTLGSVEQT
jgi:hypothetical protein